MTESTTLGRFARRQLDSMENTARAGARKEAARLQRIAEAAVRDLDNGAIPSASLTDIAARADHWATELRQLHDIKSILAADQERL